MITLITGSPCSGKTCSAIEMALKQHKPVYTNIIDNTVDSTFLPDSFLAIPQNDWTLIHGSSLIIYDSCEHIPNFTARFKGIDHRIENLITHKHFGKHQFHHDIIFIFQHEKFAHKNIRMLAELVHIDTLFNGRRKFGI